MYTLQKNYEKVALFQCRSVAIVVGLKTIVNEFTAYDRLGEFAKAGGLSKRNGLKQSRMA